MHGDKSANYQGNKNELKAVMGHHFTLRKAALNQTDLAPYAMAWGTPWLLQMFYAAG